MWTTEDSWGKHIDQLSDAGIKREEKKKIISRHKRRIFREFLSLARTWDRSDPISVGTSKKRLFSIGQHYVSLFPSLRCVHIMCAYCSHVKLIKLNNELWWAIFHVCVHLSWKNWGNSIKTAKREECCRFVRTVGKKFYHSQTISARQGTIFNETSLFQLILLLLAALSKQGMLSDFSPLRRRDFSWETSHAVCLSKYAFFTVSGANEDWRNIFISHIFVKYFTSCA